MGYSIPFENIFVYVYADEATSALDATSRILVFEALKRQRRNKTTIVITHDLSQIRSTDFAYVLKEGAVVECGYRVDLEVAGGEFQQMVTTQAEAGGFAVKEEHGYSPGAVRKRDEDAGKIFGSQRVRSPSRRTVKRKSMATQPITVGNWIFDVVSDLTRSGHRVAAQSPCMVEQDTTHLSHFVSFTGDRPPLPLKRRPSTLAIDTPPPSPAHTTVPRHLSLQVSPISPVYRLGLSSSSAVVRDFDNEGRQEAITHVVASRGRFYDGASGKHERRRWDAIVNKLDPFEGRTIKEITVEGPPQVDTTQESIFSVLRTTYSSIPCKPLIGLGTVFAIICGATTPIFSLMLSRLIFEVSNGAEDVSIINSFCGIILTVAVANGLFAGLKFIALETAGQLWVSHLRTTCYRLVLAQDKQWFDRSENTASELCRVLMLDGYNASLLISTVIPQSVVIFSMLTVGLIWALVRGWQLTFVGFAIGLVYILTMVVQSRLVAECEVGNKRAREEVARGYYYVGLESLSTWLRTDYSADPRQYSGNSRHGFRESFPRTL